MINDEVDALWLQFQLPKVEPFLLCSAYRPNQCAKYRESLLDNFEKAINYNPDVIILGDFNLNILDGAVSTFVDYMCCLLNVSQLVSEATRVTPDTKTLIDYILSSMCDLHLETCVVKTCLSDHYLVKTTLNSVVDHSHKSVTCRSFKSFDENQFKVE